MLWYDSNQRNANEALYESDISNCAIPNIIMHSVGMLPGITVELVSRTWQAEKERVCVHLGTWADLCSVDQSGKQKALVCKGGLRGGG